MTDIILGALTPVPDTAPHRNSTSIPIPVVSHRVASPLDASPRTATTAPIPVASLRVAPPRSASLRTVAHLAVSRRCTSHRNVCRHSYRIALLRFASRRPASRRLASQRIAL